MGNVILIMVNVLDLYVKIALTQERLARGKLKMGVRAGRRAIMGPWLEAAPCVVGGVRIVVQELQSVLLAGNPEVGVAGFVGQEPKAEQFLCVLRVEFLGVHVVTQELLAER